MLLGTCPSYLQPGHTTRRHPLCRSQSQYLPPSTPTPIREQYSLVGATIDCTYLRSLGNIVVENNNPLCPTRNTVVCFRGHSGWMVRDAVCGQRERQASIETAHQKQFSHSQLPDPLGRGPLPAMEEALCVEVGGLQEDWGHQAERLCCEDCNSSRMELGLEERVGVRLLLHTDSPMAKAYRVSLIQWLCP